MCYSSFYVKKQNRQNYCNRGVFNWTSHFINNSMNNNYSKWCINTESGLTTLGVMDVHNNEHVLVRNASTNTEIDDVSNMTFPNELWLVIPSDEIIIKLMAFLPIIVWGIFGNSLLLYLIIKNRHLHSPTNMLIANMAAADLANLILHPWVFLIYDFFQNYQLGEFGCKMEGWMECSVLLASVMTLSAISYDRLSAIVLPREARLTKSGAKGIMLVTWTSGFILASPLIFFRNFRERQWKDFLEKYCTEDQMVLSIYWHVLLAMSVWLPLTILLICYVSIFIKLDRYEQKVLRKECQLQVKYKTRVAKMMFIVVVTFIICRTPFTALIFYRHQLQKNQSGSVMNQAEGVLKTLWIISKYLTFLNASVNPIVYGLTNENFRRALKNSSISRCFLDKEVVQAPQDKLCKEKERGNKNYPTIITKLVFFKKNYAFGLSDSSSSSKEETSQYDDTGTIKNLPRNI